MKKIILYFILLSLFAIAYAQKSRTVNDASGLSAGQMAPLFKAMDADSNLFILEDALKESPVVIIFYRGFWCPVCNEHLGSIRDSLKLIEEAGAKVIAISPEKPEYLNVMAEKTGAEFTLLYDEGYKIADAFDVTFKPTSMQLFTYNTVLNGKLKDTHSDNAQLLPIPATYIINVDGKIIWRQFDPNYKNRSSVEEILAALKENQSIE